MDYTLTLVLGFQATVLVSFYIGRIYERMEWNKLIERGILPRPRKG